MIDNQPVLTIHRGHRRPGRTLIEAFRGGGWGPGIVGGLSIVFGFLLLANTMAATLVLPWVIAIFMLVGGIFAIFMSFRLKSAGA